MDFAVHIARTDQVSGNVYTRILYIEYAMLISTFSFKEISFLKRIKFFKFMPIFLAKIVLKLTAFNFPIAALRYNTPFGAILGYLQS